MKKQYMKILKKFEALLIKEEAQFLLNITKSIPERGVILEIGSYKGGSACILAIGSKTNKKSKVYTIDPNISNLKTLKENIKKAKMEDWIIPITKTSEKAARNWKKPISLLFIDGNHSYPSVKMDFLLWEKYLVNGGVIIFHDTRNFLGPKKVFKRYVLYSKRFNNVKLIGSIASANKLKRINLLELFKKILEYYKLRNYLVIDCMIGKVGLFIKKYFPKLYFKLRKIKLKLGV